MIHAQRPHLVSQRNAVSSRLRILASLICALLVAQTARSQSAPTYTITQITSDSTNHESPSINDKGQIVWSQQLTSVSGTSYWRVYEKDIRSITPAFLVPVPDSNHNFQFPVIDDAGDIVYLKDQVPLPGGPPGATGFNVVENRGGTETVIEFSSQDGPAVRVAGHGFGISSNGTVASYFDFCQQSCTRNFDVVNLAVNRFSTINGNLIQYFVPDINDNSTFAFVFNHQVCTALTTNPNARNCIGPGDLPRITNPQLEFNGTEVVAVPEVVYMNNTQVISTVGGVIDSGVSADVNNLGMIVYAKPDSNGVNQVFLATPYWQQCHNTPGHWGGDDFGFHENDNISMCTYGCQTTALSRALVINGVEKIPTIHRGIVDNDPGSLNLFMREQPKGQDYSWDNDPIASSTITDAARSSGHRNVTWCTQLPVTLPLLGPLHCQRGRTIVGPDIPTISTQAVADLEAIVSEGQRPALVKVHSHFHPDDPDAFHYPLVIGVVADSTCTSYFDGQACVDFLISDPAGTMTDPTDPSRPFLYPPDKLPYTMLSQYGPFSIHGFVTDPPDVSRLNITVEDNVTLLVVDAAGRRVGLDSSTGVILNEISGSAYFNTSVADEDVVDPGHVFKPPTSVTHQVDIFNPSQGAYSITVRGVNVGPYALTIRAYSQDASAQPLVTLRGIAYAGSSSTTAVQFSPAPGSTLVQEPPASQANPSVTVAGGTFTFDGAAHSATASVTGLNGSPVSGSFAFTYTPGGSSAPVNVGTYSVTAQFTSSDPNYTNATGAGTVTINPAQTTATTSVTGGMQFARVSHQATLLANGSVLVSGGQNGGTALPQSEVYNPAAGIWTLSGSNLIPRFNHTATLLQDGRVLAAGGMPSNGDCSSNVTAETYDPATGRWSLTSRLSSPVGTGHAAVRLRDGRVLVSGGGDRCGSVFSTAQVFDPSSNKWSATGSMSVAREFHTSALLSDGRVLVAGGVTSSPFSAVPSAEIYDPTTGKWTPVGSMTTPRQTSCNGYMQPFLANLPDGTVLAAGGFSGSNCFAITPQRTVVGATVSPSSVQLSNSGQTQALSVMAQMSDGSTQPYTGPLQFSSGDTTVATINSDGLVTGVGAGTTTITVTGTGIAPVSVATTVATTQLSSISVSPPAITSVGPGQIQTLAVNGQFSDGSQQALTAGVTFTSSNPAVASVDQTGLVTSGTNGMATITVSAQGASAVQVAVVVKSLVSIAVSPTSLTLTALGQTHALTVTGTYSDGSQQVLMIGLSFISSNPSVARVDLSGNVTAIANGTATVTVSLAGVTDVQVPVTVTPPVLLSVNPNSGQQGQQNLSVALAGQFTNWAQGTTTASFGAGITVASLAVNSPTSATAVLNVSAGASTGARTVSVTTGSEVDTLANGFTVAPGTPALLSVNPGGGQAGQQNLSVLLTGQFTNWVQGTTTANFGTGITVASLTVSSSTSATAVVNIDLAAVAGARTVTLTTGSEIETLPNGFTVKASVNLVTNGTFDTDANAWALAGGCGDERWVGGIGNPPGSVQLNACGEPDSDPTASQTVAGLTVGQVYTVSADVLLHVSAGPNGKSFGVFIDNEPGNPIFLGEFLDGAWHKVTANFMATKTSHVLILAAELDARTPGVTGTSDVSYYIDNVSLSPSVVAPDLTITKSHSGNFTQGQTGATYSITVSNVGSGPTIGTVAVSDTLPTSLTATALTGTGWSCSLGTLICTRTDALASTSSYPAITLTVNVASDAPASVTNTVAVSGGAEANTSNDSAADPTTITGGTPGLLSVNPNSGQQGQQNLPVALTGQSTHWVQGATIASFSTGITVSSLTVNSPTSATAVLNIDPVAPTGAGDITLITGTEIDTLINGFTVKGQPVAMEADEVRFSVLNTGGSVSGQATFEVDAKPISVLNIGGAVSDQPTTEIDAKPMSVLNLGGANGSQAAVSEADGSTFSVLNLAGISGGQPMAMESNGMVFSVLNTGGSGVGGGGGGQAAAFEIDGFGFSVLNLAGMSGEQPVDMEVDGIPFSVFSGGGLMQQVQPNSQPQKQVQPKQKPAGGSAAPATTGSETPRGSDESSSTTQNNLR